MAVSNTNKTKFIFVTGGVASSLGKGLSPHPSRGCCKPGAIK